MCLPHLQVSQAPAVREATSPDRERRRKMPHRDRQCTDNNESRSPPVVTQQDTSAVAEACMAEAESADIGMTEEEAADISMAETECADISMAETECADASMAEAESADANMRPEK